MRFSDFSLALLSLAASAFAAPAPAPAPAPAATTTPAAFNTSQEFRLVTSVQKGQADKCAFDGLYLTSYHTGAGTSAETDCLKKLF